MYRSAVIHVSGKKCDDLKHLSCQVNDLDVAGNEGHPKAVLKARSVLIGGTAE